MKLFDEMFETLKSQSALLETSSNLAFDMPLREH